MVRIIQAFFGKTTIWDDGRNLSQDRNAVEKEYEIIEIIRGNEMLKVLYEDNQYELFTNYKECRPWQTCTEELRYTKSIKGTYNYDVTKIIEASTNANDKSYSKDNLPEYELYLGKKYVQKYDTAMFVVEKDQTNNYLDELLEQLDVDLNQCANPDYVK